VNANGEEIEHVNYTHGRRAGSLGIEAAGVSNKKYLINKPACYQFLY